MRVCVFCSWREGCVLTDVSGRVDAVKVRRELPPQFPSGADAVRTGLYPIQAV